MNTTRRMTIVAILLAVAMGPAGRAAQAPAEAPEEVTLKVPVKRYAVLPADDVYQAVANGLTADVRFDDGFAGRTVIPEAVRRITVGGEQHLPVLALRTESRLVCLVSRSSEDLLRELLGLPPKWPITAAALNREITAQQGQQIIVEGAMLGAAVGERFVLAERVLLKPARMIAAQREVQLFWPGLAEPKSVTEPGSKVFPLPSRHVAERTVGVTVNVRALSRNVLMRELALRVAKQEVAPGRPVEARQYRHFSPAAVYQHAGGAERLHVQFTDRANRLIAVGEDIRTVNVVRYGRETALPIGAAFRTEAQICCLVPRELATPMHQTARMLPGQKVQVRGTVVGMMGARKCVLVDYLGFPDQANADPYPNVWLVTVVWPSRQARTIRIWDFGQYDVLDLPSVYAPGRRDALRIVLRQYREVKVPKPAVEGRRAEDAGRGG